MTRWFLLSALLSLGAILVSLGLVHVPELYAKLPDQVPTHWGLDGKADAYTAKTEITRTFLLLPLVMAGMTALTLVLPWLSPRNFDLNRFRVTYEYIMFLVVALMGYIHLVALLGSLQESLDVGKAIIGGMMLFFAAIGNVLGKVQRNYYVGVKTPWTLASDAVWIPTHRLAAWLFVGAGLGGFVLLMIGVPFYFGFAGILVAALTPVFYSLWLYKKLEREGKLEPAPKEATSP